jgi:type III secretion protein V
MNARTRTRTSTLITTLNTRRGWAGLGRQNDLALAALLMAIVALFVLPLPTPLLDLLIATNLSISLVLLIVAMYVPSALSLSTFPSLLLFTTLFRLALNIASTKLILLHANAGHIIETFGKLIVGNSVVVGGVVFLIIAIVQFIVVAKGSERVAEVAARFALDAMPGKQMSIDADVRAGVLSSSQAQRRRAMLEQECQLHGAMDGAMKFVKGDAIAGMVIALVNVLAGLAIGTLIHGMSVGDALQRYAILTVGDGMVSQIPSLLVSIAAGLVITRVGGDTGGRDTQLAGQIGRQILAHPRALLISAIAVASFLLVPGFPRWAFVMLALAILALWLVARSIRHRGETPGWISHHGVDAMNDADPGQAIAAALNLGLGSGLSQSLDRHLLELRLLDAKSAVESDLGPVFPHLQVSTARALDAESYHVRVHDVVVAQGRLRPGWDLLDPSAATVAPAGAEIGEPFGPFARVVWVRSAAADAPTIGPEEALARHVEQVVREHAPDLLGLQEVHRLLHAVQRDAPELAAEVSRVIPAQRMAEVLRRLLQEGIPIRNLNAICESLTNWAGKEADTIALTELVRIDLGHYITSRYVTPTRQLPAILFASDVLERVNAAIDRSPRGNLLLLSPAVKQDILDQVHRIASATQVQAVVIASAETRRYIKRLIEPAVPRLPVLSYQEIDDDVQLQPLGWVTNPQAA